MATHLYHELGPVPPNEWGAQIDYLAHNWEPWTPNKLIVHYGGNPSFAGDPELALERGYTEFPSIPAEKHVLRIYEQSHLSRGWRGIGYNYAVGQSGTLYILRAEQHSGATSGDFEPNGIPENEEGRAVLFLLGGNQEPTVAALDTFRALYTLTPDSQQTVIGHRDVKGTTSCPGPWLTEFIHQHQYKASNPDQEDDVDTPRWASRLRNPTDFDRMADLGIITPHERDYWITIAPDNPEMQDLRDAVEVRALLWR